MRWVPLACSMVALGIAVYAALAATRMAALTKEMADALNVARTEAAALREVLEQMGCTVNLTWVDPETLRVHVTQGLLLTDDSPTFGRTTTFGKGRVN